MPSFDELRSFAETNASTRLWIESMKDEIIEEIKPSQGHVVLLRNIIEDLLVCGAVCLEGDELVDVGTIRLLLNAEGKTPLPPAPAYIQTIKGRADVLLTAERLVYISLRGDRVYPCSPIEKVMQIKTEIRRILYDIIASAG